MKTVYINGIVYTGSLPLVEAFAVEEGRFVFSGSNDEAEALVSSGDEICDLEGHFVCSGFNDSHMHLLALGNALSAAQLAKHTESLSDMILCLKAFSEERPVREGGWILGRGWNQDYFADEQRIPNRYDLDRVSTQIPVCAVRACGHCLVVNSKAIELLGVTAETPQPDGGQIGMENGEPNGQFFDNAMGPVYDAMPSPDKETIKDMMRLACRALNSYGVTSSQTDDYCVFPNVNWETVNAAYRELEAAGELTVRVYEQSNFTELAEFQRFVEAGNKTGSGTDLFRIGPLKMLGDGALGPRTAYLSRPYADDPSTCGIPVVSGETMDAMVDYANANGMQVAIHAIGDACLDNVLHAVENALKNNPREDHRHGVVHCQISRADQLKKMQELKMHIYAQSIFLDYDINIVEARVGKELASTSYSWKTLKNGGLSVSNGSDCPVELPDVMRGIQCAVTRKTVRDGIGPYLPHEAFTVQEAIDSFTIHGAESSFEEKEKGQILPGMLADFVVLEANPLETDGNAISDIRILSTYLGGQKVYGV
ncbi:MAG: amidohydrolase [Clostridiales bacterium]|nr:amidohydrolase [Clostridiales bacterium]